LIGWRLGSIVGAITIWWLIALVMPANLLPDPWVSVVTLARNFAQGDVLPHLAITLARVAGGLALAILIGVPVGILMGVNLRAEKILDIWVMVGLTVPSLCYAIICFILVGLNEAATILAIGLTAAPAVAINLWEGVKTIDFKLVEMARIFEAGRPAILARVLLPQVLPYIMASVRMGLGIVWKIAVLVELIGRPNGVGFKLFYWYQLADMAQVLAWTLLFTLVMLAIELGILKLIEQRLFGWRPRVGL
jgi:NitT/TauT family transport system permease protein